MRVAFITAELPYPSNSGARIYTWERLKALYSKKNEIYLFSFKERDEIVHYKELSQVCTKVKVYERKKLTEKIVKNIAMPFTMISRYSNSMYIDINNLIKSNKIDLIIVDMLQVFLNCPLDNSIPKVLTVHNIEHEAFKTIAQSSKNLLKKILYGIESKKLKSIEESIIKQNIIQGYAFISFEEMNRFIDKYGMDSRCTCIPQGYELSNLKEKKENTKTIVFTGKMNYEPNVQAVTWFAEKILPHIKSEIPKCMFCIVGKNPTKRVIDLMNDENVIVTGIVKDVNVFLNKADLCVIPLKSGGGVKIKLLEALGNGKIVVSTSKGVEGTRFINKKHLLVEDDANEFAKKCIDVLKNPQSFESLTKNSTKLIESCYSWNKIGDKYYDYLSSLSNKSL